MSGLSSENVLNSLEVTIDQRKDSFTDIRDYKNPGVSDQILKIVLIILNI